MTRTPLPPPRAAQAVPQGPSSGRRPPLPALLATWVACLALAACTATPRDRHVQPQRPTLSGNTRTTPTDVLELEAGVAVDPTDPEEAFDLPVLAKLGLGPRTELFGGISLWRAAEGEASLGDSVLGVRHRLWDETLTRPATAFKLTTKLPTAQPRYGVGSGEIDFFAAGIHTRTVERYEFTGFYQLGLIGEPEAASTELELALAGAVAFDVTRRWTAFAELAGVFRPDSDLEAVFLTLGGMFRYAPWMYLDGALAIGLTSDAPEVLLLFGVTRSVGRVLGMGQAP